MSRGRSILVLLLCGAATFGAAAAGSFATAKGLDWYRSLNRPSWTPPDAVFGPVWTVLYALMTLSVWRVWTARGFAPSRGPLTLYFLHLGVNAAWSFLFFGLRSPGLALADILVLWPLIAALLRLFWTRSRAASLLLVPYLLWVSFAATLNAALWWMNR